MNLRNKIRGIFFGKPNKKKELAKAEEMLQLYVKYIPQLRKIMSQDQSLQESDGEIIGRMYDFYDNLNQGSSGFGITVNQFDGLVSSPDGVVRQPKDDRIAATPLSVMTELETVPIPFNLDGLDEKIETLKDKTKLINQRYAKEQIVGLCKRLENRKQYRENVEFYSQFPNTTDEKIDLLLSKYKLVMKPSELFVPTFPKDAIDIMKEYTRVTKKISGENPVFYVIAEEKDFKKKNEKLDPILLAQSPFGFFWNICGAWDKEMLLLSEL